MTKLREGLPPLPNRMKNLPIDEERGYPVPWFVSWIDGKPEFRAADSRKWARAINYKLCWVCGQRLGVWLTFAAGPMCGINRISAEPPSHRECAEYSVKSCPFMIMPKMVRREAGMPEGTFDPGGLMIRRNPGVILLWITKDYKLQPTTPTPLLLMGEPAEVGFYAEGRRATLEEIMESVESGLPNLIQAIELDPPEDREESHKLLMKKKEEFLLLVRSQYANR